MKGRLTAQEKDTIMRLHKIGKTYKEIAEYTHRNVDTISDFLRPIVYAESMKSTPAACLNPGEIASLRILLARDPTLTAVPVATQQDVGQLVRGLQRIADSVGERGFLEGEVKTLRTLAKMVRGFRCKNCHEELTYLSTASEVRCTRCKEVWVMD